MSVVLLALGGSLARAQDGVQLESWKFQVTPESSTVSGKPGRRLAVLLVDASRSMQKLPDGGEGFGVEGEAKSRWATVRREVDAMLQTLAEKAPGIEVRIYYFGSEVDCVAPKSATLSSAQDASSLMQQFPKKAASGGTMLYQALSLTCDRVLREHSSAPIEWLFFALLSDGEDSGSPAPFKDGNYRWDKKLESVRKVIATQAVVLPVGSEAEGMVKKGHFGNLKNVQVGGSIPAPPPPRTVYRLQLAPGGAKGVATGVLAAQGMQYRVPVEIDLTKVLESDRAGLAEATLITATVGGSPAPFTLEGSPLALGGGTLMVTPNTATDVGAGVNCTLVLSIARSINGEKNDALPTLRGEGTRTYAFRAQVAPKDPAKWKIRAPAHAKIGEAIECFADLTDPDITWRFSDGQSQKGAAISVVGKSEGVLRASLEAVSSDGKKATKPNAVAVDVIDASFTIEAKGDALLNQASEFTVNPTGKSKATYEWFANGNPCGTGALLSLKPTSVGDFDLACKATSDVGQFSWTVVKKVEVKIAPGIQLNAPTLVTEGDPVIAVECTVYGLDGKAALALGRSAAKSTQNSEIKFDKPGDKIGSVAFSIDREVARQSISGDATTGRVLPIRVTVGTNGSFSTAADVAVLPLDALPTLKSPAANASVAFGQDTQLIFAVDGADASAITAIDVEVVDAKGTKVAGGSVTGSNDWTMNFHPRSDGSMSSPLKVRGKISGPSVWFERPMVDLATLHLSAREGEYAARLDPATPIAFAPIKISMDGLADHDKGVAWRLTPIEPAGRALQAEENPWITPPLYPGKYALNAVVTLEDGSKKQIPVVTVTVEQPSDFLRVPDSVQVGQPFAGTLDEKRVPMGSVKQIQWRGPGLADQTPGTPSTHANHQFHPNEWGIHEVGVNIWFDDGSMLSDRKPVEVRGTSPSADPRVEPSEIPMGTTAVILTPNLKGDCEAVRVTVRGKNSDGTQFEHEVPCAREQSEIDIPVPPEVTQFEVVVTPIQFKGDRGRIESSSQRVIVVPRAQWWWWLLALAVLLIISWRLGKHLFGNEPMRWTLEFWPEDLGPPTADCGNYASLAIASRIKSSEGRGKPYRGWSRSDKSAYIPLWCLQEQLGGDETAWLSDGTNADLTIKLRNFWFDPFHALPGPDNHWGVAEQRHGAGDSGSDRVSATYRLAAPRAHRDTPARELWVRVRCPKGGDPLLWVFWVWVACAAIALVALLPVFHLTKPFT